MTRDEIQAVALALPAARHTVQWGGSDVYKVGGKVFAVVGIHDGLAFRVSEIGFVVLTDEGGPGRQAPYFAKGRWVIVDLDGNEIDDAAGWIATSHSLIAAKLTRATKADLGL
ncbi:MAG: MmcQ/YjbR family DNA-binding protein [Alphaproteobacteria bacterium]|nr:MmcQ/YjbR family DNA-binding protein [Alphaproteobacteria bacterium]MBU1514413.1 MmcQ/YjbR family DNA-binding protein [Alphaproteobacteria bacterium]MBU2096057.1 MmcQ/YjbR family DNA-binding protein [Alphaproteobacteria bacterium]MBU2150099.1 MmcQ/YjbR family DNA-binding protein [Alphaproteobacteria bacterium]MBU2308612.1 MmcQ/YjbR family DNA-binding protein [Alphaproteobacteria bacterium]